MDQNATAKSRRRKRVRRQLVKSVSRLNIKHVTLQQYEHCSCVFIFLCVIVMVAGPDGISLGWRKRENRELQLHFMLLTSVITPQIASCSHPSKYLVSKNMKIKSQ